MNVGELLGKEQDGVITLDGERIVLTSSAIFGTLRKDLTENLGKKRMKGFLMRYGWNLGAADAKKALEKPYASIEEALRQGVQFHMLKGYTNAKTTSFEMGQTPDGIVESIHVTGMWQNSYEAEEYIGMFGETSEPVCHTLTGYASGFYSTICDKEIIFKEIACRAAGDPECRYIGKSVEEWLDEAEEERRHYENNAIIHELEQTYEQLLEERNNLARAALIHKRLSEEVMNGNNLTSIASVMFEITEIPIVIEDVNFQTIASAGVSFDEYEQMQIDFQQTMKGYQPLRLGQTIELRVAQHRRVVTPIVLQNKLFGYCSFLYGADEVSIGEIDKMILERAAMVCSMCILNEKTSFETEERIKGNFLEQILNGQLGGKEEIYKRGGYFHLDLRLSFYMLVLKQAYAENDYYFNEKMIEEIVHYFKNSKPGVLIGQKDGSTVVFVQKSVLPETCSIQEYCGQLRDHLKNAYPKFPIRIGISTESDSIDQASRCFDEALTALKIGRRSASIVSFDDFGITSILVHEQNKEAVEQKARQLLHPLFENDQRKETELLQTMYSFLLNGGNLEKTMQDLSISMSGLRYRIDKIESLLGKNLRDPETGYELIFILKALLATKKLTF
ncbi:XylR N-terminal domain-containing protein [Sporosarcina sp. ACRSM]|uniref:XylR N-terminal domain-containing protein n=1 Tax=Sporosarcina sp. ACRSM TaxID=2918216 RepID=UPI001EF5A2A6|nr:XylR N-terminal domain-containing protein [Sporosarcina sp. ACRSM]MCG7335783.1 XylR N-terminal domain-containing protein [Sporosarcina sp. ACRSM]